MKLKKELTLVDVFCITIGAIISSGLFILPGLAHARAGPAIFISYILAGLLAATGMLSQAELASAMPKAGGTYFYVTRSMGSAVGTVYGLITFLALALKSSFELIGIAAFAVFIIDIDIRFISVPLCIIFILVNILGTRQAGRLQVWLVFCIFAALIIYFVKGFSHVNVSLFQNFTASGWSAIVSTAGFVFLSYGGLLKIASLAEEVKDPGRVLPRGMILALLVAVGFYMMVILVTVGVLEADHLGKTLTPVSDAADTFMGTWGKIIMSIAAVLAFSSAANAGIMGASRYPLALSRDELLPNFFGRINARFQTPHPALLVTGAFMIGAMFLEVESIVKAASGVLILTYLFSCLALIILKESRLQNYQPSFRAPLYPWMQIACIIGLGFLLFEIGKEAWLASAVIFVAGILVYWFYGRIRTKRDYALLALVERITARELCTHSLETELKEIITERDEIIKDRFDEIIDKCIVLDLEKSVRMDEFFEIAAEAMSDNLEMARDYILELLLSREKDSSTVISSGLAIPHIVIEGEGKFDILLARCREGIEFSGSAPDVHAVFVLIGTKDERNFHLRALAAIAQIVHDPHFEEKWMKAKSKEALRDIVLLGKRRR
jgi:APA family basic amino acid/polyamine antiporter